MAGATAPQPITGGEGDLSALCFGPVRLAGAARGRPAVCMNAFGGL
jgi:hypothetical protein